MILLREFTSEIDAERLSQRLRVRGILTHVSGKQSKQLGALVTGTVKVGVWAVLEDQTGDAIALVTNNRHQVVSPLTEEEMLEIEAQATSINDGLGAVATKALVGISVLGVVLYVLLKTLKQATQN